MSRFGNRLPRSFDVDAYMTRLWGDSKAGPIGKAPLPVPIVGETAELPDIFQAYCRDNGLAMPVREFKFCETRNFRFDHCFVANRLAIEWEGGIWRDDRGAHGRPQAILRDMEKYNLAQLLGFRVLRYQPTQYSDAVRDIKIMLAKEAA